MWLIATFKVMGRGEEERNKFNRYMRALSRLLRRLSFCGLLGGLVHPALLHHLSHALVVLPSVPIIQLRSLGVGGGGGIRVAQKGLDGGQYRGDVVDWTPLVL